MGKCRPEYRNCRPTLNSQSNGAGGGCPKSPFVELRGCMAAGPFESSSRRAFGCGRCLARKKPIFNRRPSGRHAACRPMGKSARGCRWRCCRGRAGVPGPAHRGDPESQGGFDPAAGDELDCGGLSAGGEIDPPTISPSVPGPMTDRERAHVNVGMPALPIRSRLRCLVAARPSPAWTTPHQSEIRPFGDHTVLDGASWRGLSWPIRRGNHLAAAELILPRHTWEILLHLQESTPYRPAATPVARWWPIGSLDPPIHPDRAMVLLGKVGRKRFVLKEGWRQIHRSDRFTSRLSRKNMRGRQGHQSIPVAPVSNRSLCPAGIPPGRGGLPIELQRRCGLMKGRGKPTCTGRHRGLATARW